MHPIQTSEILPLLTVSVFSCTILGETPIFVCEQSFEELTFPQAKECVDTQLDLIVKGNHPTDGACMIKVLQGSTSLISYFFINEKVEVRQIFNLF